MKQKRFVVCLVLAVGVMLTSYLAGSLAKEQEYRAERAERCAVLVGFALDKLENQDITDPDMMEAVISNVYAAYQYCDDPALQGQLHDLWNALIFEEEYPAREETAKDVLQSVAEGLDGAKP